MIEFYKKFPKIRLFADIFPRSGHVSQPDQARLFSKKFEEINGKLLGMDFSGKKYLPVPFRLIFNVFYAHLMDDYHNKDVELGLNGKIQSLS